MGVKEVVMYKPITNADRIRNMTDEELAEFMSSLIKDTEDYEYCKEDSDWLKWLQAEVKEGAE